MFKKGNTKTKLILHTQKHGKLKTTKYFESALFPTILNLQFYI